jgi:hypothetical protein
MKKIILMLFVIGFFFKGSYAQDTYNYQTAHAYGLEFGYYGYPEYSLNDPYKDLALKSASYWRISPLNLSLKLSEKSIPNRNDYRMLFLYTGLSIQWNTYRFDDDVRILTDDDGLKVYRDENPSKKSKLVVTYLVVPLILEYQFNQYWWVSAGAEFDFKVGSYSRYINYVDGEKVRYKARESFWLNNFKPDLVAKIGFLNLSIVGRYSLVPLFKEDKGPELFPYSLSLNIVI